jgi:predicted RNase H-like HicB family nuclease
VTVDVYIESGKRRVFACAVDWPGWCRSGKTEEQALAELAEAGTRYADIARMAGHEPPPSLASFQVVERLTGTGTTDFGAPDAKAESDWRPMDAEEGKRLAAVVQASWKALDQAAMKAPEKLPKGPRGGGRDRDQIIDHVLAAEAAYARRLGIRMKEPTFRDRQAITELRTAINDRLGGAWDGNLAVEKGWPPRYAARRIAWHVLDHAWELEDKSHS